MRQAGFAEEIPKSKKDPSTEGTADETLIGRR
jgi:hypothetical protein